MAGPQPRIWSHSLQHAGCVAVMVQMLSLGACETGEHDTSPESRLSPTDLHRRVLTLDAHIDVPANLASDPMAAEHRALGPGNFDDMRAGGLDGAFFVAWLGQTARTRVTYEAASANALATIQAIHQVVEDLYPDTIEIAYSAADVERIHASGKLVALIGLENGMAIGQDLALLETFQQAGVRYLTLVHSGHNDIADSATPLSELGDEPSEHGGLSAFGRDVVAEINRLGMLVDVSHSSPAAALDVIDVSRAPVIASHSGVRSLADSPRNVDDELLSALRDNRGVICLVAYPGYVRLDPREKMAAAKIIAEEVGLRTVSAIADASADRIADYLERLDGLDDRWPRPTLADFVDHVDYVVQRIGVQHVCLASDFPGGGVTGWRNVGETENVTAELLRRSYNEQEIAQMWSGNLLRVMRETEQAAVSSEY